MTGMEETLVYLTPVGLGCEICVVCGDRASGRDRGWRERGKMGDRIEGCTETQRDYMG